MQALDFDKIFLEDGNEDEDFSNNRGSSGAGASNQTRVIRNLNKSCMTDRSSL